MNGYLVYNYFLAILEDIESMYQFYGMPRVLKIQWFKLNAKSKALRIYLTSLLSKVDPGSNLAKCVRFLHTLFAF